MISSTEWTRSSAGGRLRKAIPVLSPMSPTMEAMFAVWTSRLASSTWLSCSWWRLMSVKEVRSSIWEKMRKKP